MHVRARTVAAGGGALGGAGGGEAGGQRVEIRGRAQRRDGDAVRLIRHNHPRFLDDRIPWLPKRLSDSEVRSATLAPDDARLAIARWYSFESWVRLVEWAEAVARQDSPVSRFESAVEAVINVPPILDNDYMSQAGGGFRNQGNQNR